MKQILIRKGAAVVADVPAPGVDTGEVLVRVQSSCLSVGTELSGIRHSAIPLWKRALRQPEKLVTTMRMVRTQGWQRTWSLIEERRDAAHPTGYSAAGIVEAVGSDIQDLRPGDRVACAGAQCAHHAEYIRVPRNLCVPIGEELDFDSASTVTLGAIALQGVRRAQPTLGERFVVIGLGILGQLTVQLLRANGCRTIGVDVDPGRLALAKQLGMDVALDAGQSDDGEHVARLTDGFGADGVIITAATASDAVISTAFKMCRKKGRVVLVGDVGLNLNREDFYAKEIDFLISTSYGPGRYDRRYEEQGLDYPVAYVRWTENRNMAEYVRLLAEKRVQLEPLISARFAVEQASAAYASIGGGGTDRPMMVLLTYPQQPVPGNAARTLTLNSAPRAQQDVVRIAVIGAGSFARSAHLPNLRSMGDRVALHAVVTGSGHTAAAVAQQFGARYASTDYEAVLRDPDVDAVIIATRHHLHATMALAALQAGKHVLLEKPTALTAAELDALDTFIAAGTDSSRRPVLLTGFNRRFSPHGRRMAELLTARTAPFILNYRMNAGHIPLDHWVHGPQGGGRNIGEACHIYDLFTYLAATEVASLSAHSIVPQSGHYARTDNFIATLSFADGSVASLTYTALGSKDYPKETADLYVDGKLAVLDDYKGLAVFGAKGRSLQTAVQEKGLKEELDAFIEAIRTGQWPIPWWQQLQTARIALRVEAALLDR